MLVVTIRAVGDVQTRISPTCLVHEPPGAGQGERARDGRASMPSPPMLSYQPYFGLTSTPAA